MKIRMTADTKIPLVVKGKVFDVECVSEAQGEKVYFIHHAGNYLGIRACDCVELEERADG